MLARSRQSIADNLRGLWFPHCLQCRVVIMSCKYFFTVELVPCFTLTQQVVLHYRCLDVRRMTMQSDRLQQKCVSRETGIHYCFMKPIRLLNCGFDKMPKARNYGELQQWRTNWTTSSATALSGRNYFQCLQYLNRWDLNIVYIEFLVFT